MLFVLKIIPKYAMNRVQNTLNTSLLKQVLAGGDGLLPLFDPLLMIRDESKFSVMIDVK